VLTGPASAPTLRIPRSRRHAPDRHEIEQKNSMTADVLKGALDTFARHTVVRQIAAAQAGRTTEKA
jgi:hypothetical protein